MSNGAVTTLRTPEDIARLQAFCRSRSFDLDWYPGIREDEANRYNQLEQSWFHDGIAALLGPQRAELIERYKFNIAPATDDRPYFFHFFRWRTLPELLRLKEQGGLPLLEWGYPLVLGMVSAKTRTEPTPDPGVTTTEMRFQPAEVPPKTEELNPIGAVQLPSEKICR